MQWGRLGRFLRALCVLMVQLGLPLSAQQAKNDNLEKRRAAFEDREGAELEVHAEKKNGECE